MPLGYYRFLCKCGRGFAVLLAFVTCLIVGFFISDIITEQHKMAHPVGGLLFCGVQWIAAYAIWKFATAVLRHMDRMP